MLTHFWWLGRGFVACFLHNAGYEVIFSEVNDTTVGKLNAQKSYRVIEVGADGTTESTITNYRAINSRTHEAELVREIATADLVTCSVGPNILKFIAPVIAKGIDARSTDLTPVAVIACENAIGATDTLAEFIKSPENTSPDRLADYDKRATFANSAIDRIVPAQDADAGLDVKLEKFYEWVVESTPFKNAGYKVPDIEGINWVENLQPFIERKLYTVNTGHATAAYHGYIRRKSTVYDALQDKEIQQEVKKALANTANLITQKHGISKEDQQAYVDKIVRRISNPHLEDAVERVGRAPMRKLSRKERFIGPAAELAEHGKDCSALLDAAECAFRFQKVEGDEESFELANIMENNDAEEVVKKVCGLEPKEKLFPAVVEVVRRVQADTQEE
jgi:mannitol-1-phosphate 5-dehydrogenase